MSKYFLKKPIILLLFIGLNCTGCAEIIFGTICSAGIIFSFDEKQKTQQLPPATVGQYYEYVINIPSNIIYTSRLKESLPEGLTLVALESPSNSHEKNWLLKGVPLTLGKYEFSIKGEPFRTMCGNSDYIYPYALQVLPSVIPN